MQQADYTGSGIVAAQPVELSITFQRWFEGEAPPKPDEALVRRLAWQAGLNGDTGVDAKTGMPKKPIK